MRLLENESIQEKLIRLENEIKDMNYKEGEYVYYITINTGKYGDYQDIVNIVKTKIESISEDYKGNKIIILDYYKAEVNESLFENRLYKTKDELREFLKSYVRNEKYIKKEAGINTSRYFKLLLPSYNLNLASSRENLKDREYLVHLESGQDLNNLNKFVRLSGVKLMEITEKRHLKFSNRKVEKDFKKLNGYYGERELDELIEDIINSLDEKTELEYDLEYDEYNDIDIECLLKNKTFICDLARNETFINELLKNPYVIKLIAMNLKSRSRDDIALNSLVSYIMEIISSKF